MDCLLASPIGIDMAARAAKGVFDHMATPGTWISVSHSPPLERLDLYTDHGRRYFHDTKAGGGPPGGRGGTLGTCVLLLLWRRVRALHHQRQPLVQRGGWVGHVPPNSPPLS